MKTGNNLTPIPSGLNVEDLITAVNDRLRRIAGGADTTTTITRMIVGGGGAVPASQVNYGTHVQRKAAPVSAFGEGALWYETDRTVWYQLQAGGASAGSWRWIDGECICTQANLPTDLGANDKGFLANVTDYNHVLAWSGTAWTAGPGWDEPCYIRGFMVDPTGTGWKLCDGNGDDGSAIGVAHPVKYLKPDGTLGSLTSATVAPCVPNLVGSPAFLQFGATATGINAPVAPTLAMNSYTPAGTNSTGTVTPLGTIAWPAGVPTFAGTALPTHQHEIPVGFISPNSYFLQSYGTGSAQAISKFFPGSATTGNVAAELDQAKSAGTPSGTISWPAGVPTFAGSSSTTSAETFTGTPATLTGTISNTGTPQGITLRPWFRK